MAHDCATDNDDLIGFPYPKSSSGRKCFMQKKLRILFRSQNDTSIGSTRIWINDLSYYLAQIGADTAINNGSEYKDYDVVIFEKGTPLKEIERAKKDNPNIICGLINPTDDADVRSDRLIGFLSARKASGKHYQAADFFIVGSVEERDYFLRYSPNVFMFPLIERIFTGTKTHTAKEVTTLSYHGNLQHLNQFAYNLKDALEELNGKYQIKLMVIYDLKLGEWTKGRPDIPIETYQWSSDTIEDLLLQSDIGLVPGVNTLPKSKYKKLLRISTGFYDGGQERFFSDYLLRFKNKSNAGRSFVYHQLSIPVVAGFNPSSFHIIGSNQNGFLAHSKEGWYSAIEQLILSPSLRTKMADGAKREFDKNYDPIVWAEGLYKSISSLV